MQEGNPVLTQESQGGESRARQVPGIGTYRLSHALETLPTAAFRASPATEKAPHLERAKGLANRPDDSARSLPLRPLIEIYLNRNEAPRKYSGMLMCS
jgi:hypothetical protein